MRKLFSTLTVVIVLFNLGNCQKVAEILPQEAYQMLKAQNTYLVDVRSVAEYVFVGHPEMAYNIPFMFWCESEQKLLPNDDFLKDLEARFKKDDVLIFMCRSGGRSLKAAEQAKQAGFTKTFNLKEGFEGAKDKQGCRQVNGWKNRGLPYSCEQKEGLTYQPLKKEMKKSG